jgi:hypothetical protein
MQFMKTATAGTTARRLVRGTVLAAAMAAAVTGTASAASAASAAPTAPRGLVTVEGCTSVAGTTSFQPGLTKTARAQTAVLSATIGGCSNAFNGASPGTGTLTANLSGVSSTAAVSLRGTFTVNWPAASGFNPSNGNAGLTGPDAQGNYVVSGSITSGAFTGGFVRTTLLVTGTNTGADGSTRHPIKTQQVTNTAPLQVQRSNF